MPEWSQSGTYSGLWTFQYGMYPGAAFDTAGNLLVAWSDNNEYINISYIDNNQIEEGNVSVTQYIFPVDGGAQGSPSVAYASNSFFLFWRSVGGQLRCGQVNAQHTALTSNSSLLNGANSNDGPQLAVDPNGTTIWVGWRGVGDDPTLYFSSLDTTQPVGAGWNTSFLRGYVPVQLQSYYSPAVGLVPGAQGGNANLCTMYRGSGDINVWGSSCTLNPPPPQLGFLAPSVVSSIGSCEQRPSMVILSSSTGELLVTLRRFNQLYYASGSFTQPGPASTAFNFSSSSPISLPMLNQPSGLLVTPAAASNPTVYLLAYEYANNTCTNVFYLYKYMP